MRIGFKKKEPTDPTWRYQVLEQLIEKCDTPEQIQLLMEMNVDRTAGLLKEIYQLEGQCKGYRIAFEELAQEIVHWKREEE